MIMYTEYLKVLIYCLAVTLVVEILFALILGLRKKDLLNVLLVNILTNPLMNCIHPLILFEYGKTAQLICFIILEIVVVLVEGFIYKKYLNYSKINSYILSLILNIASCGLGLLLNYFIF